MDTENLTVLLKRHIVIDTKQNIYIKPLIRWLRYENYGFQGFTQLSKNDIKLMIISNLL